jgi:type III restriction enzyme
MTLKLQFDPNQPHQTAAVEAIARLFEGLPRHAAQFSLGGDIVPNLPPYESLSEPWLYDNLRKIQEQNQIQASELPLLGGSLELDDGFELEGISPNSWRAPSFTVEMETGTGKTYVYLRAIHELRQRYGFGKFIIVVPSIAIYEGVIKTFKITRDHFRALYQNETVNLIEYDGARLSQLRAFATSTFVEILVITLDSFNKASNVIFKPSEKLPGERLPYQYIQETRPILILDEPQNMESDKAREALRTLHPLFSLRFSATHRSAPNPVYRLTPFDAYRLNLVKKIQVFGVTERDNLNRTLLALESIENKAGLRAVIRTHVSEFGLLKEAAITLKHGDNLYAKTHNDDHRDGFTVREINARENFVEFENGTRLSFGDRFGVARAEVFRAQIRQTIQQHMEMQGRLQRKGLKVLSLFFIDRVANYTAPDGLIRLIFDEEFERLKRQYPFYAEIRPEQVRSAYFAKKKAAKGDADGEAIDTESKNQAERDAEKAAFALIMRDKERLLAFEEKTCFIFAHSALKEGWDNPNVFQICTLNQTVSELKKRQEIGRGLRLAVDQSGERVFDEDVNILSVIANESYESYVSRLQTEYKEDGQTAPAAPTRAGKSTAARRDEIFHGLQAFRDFWAKLQKRTSYTIQVDTAQLVDRCIERINKRTVPKPVIVVEKGKFIVTDYTLSLLSCGDETCKIRLATADTAGNESNTAQSFSLRDDLSKILRDDRLRGLRVVKIVDDSDNSYVEFGDGRRLFKDAPLRFQSEQGQRVAERGTLAPAERYPIPNLIDRAAKETGLTRPTLNQIFKGLSDRQKENIFANPEGFAGLFITEISETLADHIAERIQFQVDADPAHWGYDLEDLFPETREYPQKELVSASPASLYDQVQVDSEVESRFVEYRLNADDNILFYFKFPPKFKLDFPRIIGNYNPDWGIARYRAADDKFLLELVRETKGGVDLDLLRFPHEKRKIECATKVFEALGVDYRVVSDTTVDWWESEARTGGMGV